MDSFTVPTLRSMPRPGSSPIEEAWGTRVENSNAYWYVTSQVAQPQEKPVLPAPSVEVEDSVSDLMAPLATQETETRPASSVRRW